MKLSRSISACLLVLLAALAAAPAPAAAWSYVPWRTVPTWSTPYDNIYSTGCALDDVDGDGWPDLALSNGNDMRISPNYVFMNSFGVVPTAPTWQSDDERYSGHCNLGDLDGDGLPELVVVNYIGIDWEPGLAQYYQNGIGGLATAPIWESGPLYSFRGALGDPDGDGDLDLALATGEAYNAMREPNRIHFNDGGTMAPGAGWTTQGDDTCYDARFVDIDRDGDLDLAFLASGGPASIYFNEDGVLAREPAWTTAASDNGNTFDFGDVNGDGWTDLVVATNTQLGGSGRFYLYLADAGTLHDTPDWQSADNGYGSLVKLVDVEGDGDLDLITGRWWGKVSVYLNDDGFGPFPEWACDADWISVVEGAALIDLDRGAETSVTAGFSAAAGRLLDLGRRHLQGIDAVTVDGLPLARTQWCSSREDGWISLAVAAVDTITVTYRWSPELDLAISNWDGVNYIFHFDPLVDVAPPVVAAAVVRHRAYPNPFNPRTTIAFTLPRGAHVSLNVHDLRGRRVAQLIDDDLDAGDHQQVFDAQGLASGLYVYRLLVAGKPKVGKILLVR